MKTVPAALLAFAIALSAWFISRSWRSNHHVNDIITVKGMAKKDFTSDLIIWEANFNRKSSSMQEAYASIKTDAETVKKYLLDHGVPLKEITFSAVNIDREYDEARDKEGLFTRKFKGFELKQTVTIESHDIEKIDVISREITDLINSGIELASESPRFYNTKLAELKLEMLSAATKDARSRAENISDNAGSHLGKLRNATMGVFQITGKNSEEDYSYGGAFNTSAKEKTASITVNLEFAVE